MLKVQEYLRSGNTPQDLKNELAINYANHPLGENLVILDYNQIESPKKNPIVKECRGLVLETGTWNIAAKPFNRFFNFQEDPETDKMFNWNKFTCQEKLDGSLMLCYQHKDSIRVNTRFSFGMGQVNDSGKTWQDYFWNIIDEIGIQYVFDQNPNLTLVFEFCSPYNKVVILYPEPRLYLLTVIDNNTLEELEQEKQDEIAEQIRVCRPNVTHYSSAEEIVEDIKQNPGDKFEGVVINDNKHRIKIKNPNYLILHRLWNNGNILSPKNLVPLILANEDSEVAAILPGLSTEINKIKTILDSEFAKLSETWEKVKGIENPKSYAITVKDERFASILFTAYKNGLKLEDVWRNSPELILKKCFKSRKEQ